MSYQMHIIMMAKACEHIDLTSKDYGASSKLYSGDPSKIQILRLSDAAAIVDLNGPTPEIPEETALKMYKSKIQRDLLVYRKMNNVRFMASEKQF